MNDNSHGRAARLLQPDDLRTAANAFQAALQTLDESIPIDPFTSRRILARYVIEHVFEGEFDEERLRDGALEHLRRVGRAMPGDRAAPSGGRPRTGSAEEERDGPDVNDPSRS